jgi:nitrogen regulatory protein P-II 1
MKLLKALVRGDHIGTVVHALQRARAPGITVSIVRGVGYDFLPRSTDPRVFPLFEDELARCPEVAKVEVVCGDEEIDRLIAAVVNAARTGAAGDGIVFVTAVERAIKVRTGEEGAPAFSAP